MRKSFRQTVWLRLPATTIRTSTDKQRTFFVPTLGICICNWICLHCTRTLRLEQKHQSICYALHVSSYVAMHCESRNLALVYICLSRDGVERKSCQRAQQNTGAKSKYFDLHPFCINTPQYSFFIRGSLCSSVKIENSLRCGRPRDCCSIPGSSSLL